MTTTVLTPTPKQKFFGNNGQPLVGGKLFTYAAGTATKTPTYTNSTGVSQNANPVILDYRGEADIWLVPNVAYKFALAPANDTDPPSNPIWTIDQLVNTQLLSLFGGVDTGTANAYVLTFTTPISPYTDGFVIYWIPANNNTGASTINVNGLGPVSIVNPDGSPLYVNEIVSGEFAAIAYLSGEFRLLTFGLNPTINTQNTNYVLSLVDANNVVLHSDSSAYTYTIPADATADFAVGTGIEIVNQSNAQLTISPALGASFYPFGAGSLVSQSVILEAATSCLITKTGVNTWVQSTQTNVIFSGSVFTGTVTGLTAGVTGTVFYRRIGQLVTLWITANIQGTSNSTGMGLTGMPVAIRPTSAAFVVPSLNMLDNGAAKGGWATVQTSGVILFGLGIDGSTLFTAAGTKGLSAGWTITYPVA